MELETRKSMKVSCRKCPGKIMKLCNDTGNLGSLLVVLVK